MKTLIGFFLAAILTSTALAKNVAVVVFPQQKAMQPYARVAQTRLEQLLADNDMTVLDQEKAKQLQKSWAKLEDPSYLITAEEFVEKARKFKIDGLYRIYLTGGSAKSLGSVFSATAHVDLSYVDAEAQIKTISTPVMGVKGFPPSDGLTETAAQSNAVLRALDYAAEKNGLRVLDFTNPRLIGLTLTASNVPPDLQWQTRQPGNPAYDDLPNRFKEAFKGEDVSCRATSPDGKMAAVGGYIWQINKMGGISRLYGSRLHVLDLETRQTILTLTTHNVAKREKGENGPSTIHDCLFLNSWRYLAAITGNRLFFWDTERGTSLFELPFEEGLESARLELAKQGDKDYLLLISPKVNQAFQITSK